MVPAGTRPLCRLLSRRRLQEGSARGKLVGIGFVPMMVSFVGGTHLLCKSGGNPQGYSPHQVTSFMRVFSMERSGLCQGETILHC